LALDREGERGHGALHALEHVDAQQVDEAFLAVDLAEEALAAANLGAVLLVVGGLLVRQHVPQRRVGGQVQAADLVVDLADRGNSPARSTSALMLIGFSRSGKRPVSVVP
jgi:hypothetical protein